MDLWQCTAPAPMSTNPARVLIILLAVTGIALNSITAPALFRLTCQRPASLVLLAVQCASGVVVCFIWFAEVAIVPQNWIGTHQEGIRAPVCILWYSHYFHTALTKFSLLNLTLLVIDRTLEVTKKMQLRFTMDDSRVREYYGLIVTLSAVLCTPQFLTVNIDLPGVCRCSAMAGGKILLMISHAEVYIWFVMISFVCIPVMSLCVVVLLKDDKHFDDWAGLWHRGEQEDQGHVLPLVSWRSPSACIVPLTVTMTLTYTLHLGMSLIATAGYSPYVYNSTVQLVGVALRLLHVNLVPIIALIYIPHVRKVIRERI